MNVTDPNKARERTGRALGVSLPPCRLDYENFRTDCGIGMVGTALGRAMHVPA
jgi:hypothetical protein